MGTNQRPKTKRGETYSGSETSYKMVTNCPSRFMDSRLSTHLSTPFSDWTGRTV